MLLACRRQQVIKDPDIESAMVKAYVCTRNICRVMKLRVAQEADRWEMALEVEQLGPLLTTLVGALKARNPQAVSAFSAVVDASNGLEPVAIEESGGGGSSGEEEGEGPEEGVGAAGAGSGERAGAGTRAGAGEGAGARAGTGKRKRGAGGEAGVGGLSAPTAAAGAGGRKKKKRKMKHVNIPKVTANECTRDNHLQAHDDLPPSSCKQVHGLCHYDRNMRKFGCGLNFCTCHWELYHRDGVIKPFKTVSMGLQPCSYCISSRPS